jgi:hypothetical protein
MSRSHSKQTKRDKRRARLRRWRSVIQQPKKAPPAASGHYVLQVEM